MANPNSAEYDQGVHITKVACVSNGPHTFACVDTASDGSSASTTATVSADGTTWVTSGGS